MKIGLGIYKRVADISNSHSLISNVRRKRCKLLLGLIDTIGKAPIRILDVGGTLSFWEVCGFTGAPNCEITLLNLDKVEVSEKYEYIKGVQGNGAEMGIYEDKEFDLVVSDSVIEHIWDCEKQKKMAREIQRVGKWYFVQTPNFFFPVEPHLLFPFFHFLPLLVRTQLLRCFGLGARKPVRLLKKREVRQLFPEGVILKETICELTQSFIVVGGWGCKR